MILINVPSTDLLDEVMVCSRNYPKEVDEFKDAKLKENICRAGRNPSIKLFACAKSLRGKNKGGDMKR